MALTDAQIVDLGLSTQKDLGRLKFQQIAQALTDYEVMGRIMRKDRIEFQGGTGIKRNLMTKHSDAAKHVGLYEEDTVNVADVLANIDIPWRRTTTNYAYERRELLMNKGPQKIVDLLKVRRTDAMLALTELMETAFWSKPTDSTDDLLPFGIPYWIVKNSTEGHTGGNPSGFTSGAGNLDVASYPMWKNWSAQYSAVTKADLIKKMRKGHRNIKFKSPVDVPDYRRGRGDRYRIYLNEDTLSNLEDLGEAQNENLGRDLAPMDDTIAFKRHPLVAVPFLNADSTNPIYMVDMSTFAPVFLKGDYLRETAPIQKADMHNVFVVHVDLTWNILCDDRRRQAVFYV